MGPKLAIISFVVPGPPRGKGRPRFFVRKGMDPQIGGEKVFGTGTYTDDNTANYENLVKVMFLAARQQQDFDPLGGKYPVKLAIEITMPVTASKPKWWRERAAGGEIAVTTTPDLDNCEKVCMDALNRVAYRDDSQVCMKEGSKFYGETAQMSVVVTYYDVPRRTMG